MKKKKAQQLISANYVDDIPDERERQLKTTGFASIREFEEKPIRSKLYTPTQPRRPNSFANRKVRYDKYLPPMAAPKNANEVQMAIQDELDCWGIDKGRSIDHAKFYQLAVDESIMRFHGDKSRWTPPDTTCNVPRDLSDAIEFLLDFFLRKMMSDGKRVTFSNTRDLLEARFGANLPFAPFFKENGNLVLSSAYRKIPRIKDYIDPFIRFSHADEDPRTAVTATWTKTSSEGVPHHIVKAAAIHQLIHGGLNCVCCKTFGSFKLNSKYNTSFSDVICSICGSVYAIWTVATTASMFKWLHRGNFKKAIYFGDYYDEIRHIERLSYRYGIFASMEDTLDMPAYVVKIKGVLPSLSGRSFNFKNIKIFSNILIEPVVRKIPWFSFSLPGHLDFVSTSLVAIHKYFSGLVIGDGERAPKTQASGVHNVTSKSELRRLRRNRNKIEAIKKKDDNGVELANEEVDLLGREKEVLRMIKEFENFLRLAG
ncbi:hypothetical protein ACHAXS_011763 [Conticribra weissflogii]